MDPRLMAAMQTNPQFQNLLQRLIQWQAARNQFAMPMQSQSPFIGQPQYNGPPSQFAPNQIGMSPAAGPPDPRPTPGGEGGSPAGNAYGFYGTQPPQQQGNAYAYGQGTTAPNTQGNAYGITGNQPSQQPTQPPPVHGQPQQGYGSDQAKLKRPNLDDIRRRYGR
jgi:hypothetical protein